MKRSRLRSLPCIASIGLAAACVPPELTYDPGSRKEAGPTTGAGGRHADGAVESASGAWSLLDGRSDDTSVGNPNSHPRDARADARVDARPRSDAHADAPNDARPDALDSGDAGSLCFQTLGDPKLVDVVAKVSGLVADGSFSDYVYCIDATEVTNADYEGFMGANRATTSNQHGACDWNKTFVPFDRPDGSLQGAPDEPVTGVDWCDATAYCSWVGKRLCGRLRGGASSFRDFANARTNEWYNACSSEGSNKYPYGNGFEPGVCAAPPATKFRAVGTSLNCKTPVGVFDLSGNAWEWENSCNADVGASDECRARGGSYASRLTELGCDADSTQYRTLERSTQDGTVGFRCCVGLELPP